MQIDDNLYVSARCSISNVTGIRSAYPGIAFRSKKVCEARSKVSCWCSRQQWHIVAMKAGYDVRYRKQMCEGVKELR
jgi:hypothetical protein